MDYRTYLKKTPDANGYYGPYGGSFIPNELIPGFQEIADAYQSIAHSAQFISELRRIRKEYQGDLSAIPRFCTADVVFEEEKTLDLGGVTAQLIRVGGPHSEDSVVCYVPEEKFVFLADSAGKDLYGIPWDYDPNDQAASDLAMERMPDDPLRLRKYREALERLDFERCLKGHAPCSSRSELIKELQEREARL